MRLSERERRNGLTFQAAVVCGGGEYHSAGDGDGDDTATADPLAGPDEDDEDLGSAGDLLAPLAAPPRAASSFSHVRPVLAVELHNTERHKSRLSLLNRFRHSPIEAHTSNRSNVICDDRDTRTHARAQQQRHARPSSREHTHTLTQRASITSMNYVHKYCMKAS